MKNEPSWPNERLDEELSRLYAAPPAPESFRASWRAAVCREETQRMQKKKAPARVWLRVALPAAACLVLVAGTLATGNMDFEQPIAAPEQAAQMELREWATEEYEIKAAAPKNAATRSSAYTAGAGSADNGAADGIAAQDERKIVRTAEMVLATGDFDADRARIESLVSDAGGYIELQSVNADAQARRSADYTLRVPAPALDDFLARLQGVGRVLLQSQSATDRSARYYDAETRLDTQRQKLRRLSELLAKAEQVSDLIEIESAIADAQYQIDSYQSTVSRLQKQVDESAVSVTLRETGAAEASQAQDTPLGERIGQGLRASLAALGRFFQNMLVFVVMASPVLVPLVIAAVVILLIVKRRGRRKENDL